MKKIIFLCCIPLTFISGCAVLSDSQVESVHAFAVTAKNYTNFPSEAVRKSQKLQYHNNVLEASALVDSNQVIHSLDIAKTQYEKGLTFSDKMDLSLNLIQSYAALLAQLSSDSYSDDLGRSAKELSGELNGAIDIFNAQLSTKIPANVGKGIAQIITIIGNRIIKNKQAKAIQKFVPLGDTLIQLTSNNLVSALNEELEPLIKTYKATFRSDFNSIIFGGDKVSYPMLQFYIKTNADFISLELLRQRCLQSAVKMASAHKELQANIMKKKTLDELLGETKAFIADVKELYGIVNTLSNND
jgi:hypothetical protein